VFSRSRQKRTIKCYTIGVTIIINEHKLMEEEVKACDNCEMCADGCTMHEGGEAPSAEAEA
jgi:heterodisulfide reductase subunit C